jgi:hypothetical protein
MSVYKENEVRPLSKREFILGLALIALIFFTLGLVTGQPLGEKREHHRICSSPQVPFSAPVNIPACK